MPNRQRSAASSCVTSSPRNSTAPDDGINDPIRTLRSVVFPAPLGPTIPTAWSVATLKSTRSSTTRAPKCLLTDVADKIAAWGSVFTTAHFLTRRDHRQGQVQRILVIRRLSRALL